MKPLQHVPVLLLTGYLGSGKTTLLNRILTNERGIRFAVIVNDIGEVNIDADLIQKGGIVDQSDESLVALQNGCICCTLKMDLVQQLNDIMAENRFDYIVIEASGICEPAPIAQTIVGMPDLLPASQLKGIPELDTIVTVVDALRLKDEFGAGEALVKPNIEEEDLENLVIQQIEFCNIILLNKANDVEPKDLERIRQIIRAIQPKAKIIDTNYCDVELEEILNTHMFDFDEVALSATWVQEVEGHHGEEDEDEEEEHERHHHEHEDEEEHEHHHHHHDHDHDDDDHDEEHCPDPEHCHHHHHHHHHHHDEGEAEEYGIGTFVYFRREPFNIGLFDEFVAKHWPKSVIRAKGMCYFKNEYDLCQVFEQAGRQFTLRNAGRWYATMPQDELNTLMIQEPQIRKDWDPIYGDRMQKLVFIGQKMDKKAITEALDKCLDR